MPEFVFESGNRREYGETSRERDIKEKLEKILDEIEEEETSERFDIHKALNDVLDRLEDEERHSKEIQERLNEVLDELEEEEFGSKELEETCDKLNVQLAEQVAKETRESSEEDDDSAAFRQKNDVQGESIETSEGQQYYKSEAGTASIALVRKELEPEIVDDTTSKAVSRDAESNNAETENASEQPSEIEPDNEHETHDVVKFDSISFKESNEADSSSEMPQSEESYSTSEKTKERIKVTIENEVPDDIQEVNNSESKKSQEYEETSKSRDQEHVEGDKSSRNEFAKDETDLPESNQMNELEEGVTSSAEKHNGQFKSTEDAIEDKQSVEYMELDENSDSQNDTINFESGKLEEDVPIDFDKIMKVLRDESEAWPDLRMKSMFPETEEENISRKLKEAFERLDEEEREALIEKAREVLESVEDIEGLFDHYPKLGEHQITENELHETEQYLHFLQLIINDEIDESNDEKLEEIASELDIEVEEVKSWLNRESLPELIKVAWNMEIERIWTKSIVRVLLQDGRDEMGKRDNTVREVGSHPNSVRKFSIFFPVINGYEIRSFQKLQNLVTRRTNGLLENNHIRKLMVQAELHLRFIWEFVGKSAIFPSEIEEVALKLGVPHTTARKWVLKGAIPTIYHWIDEGIKNQQRGRSIRLKLGEYQKAEAVRARLYETGLNKSIETWKTSNREWKRLSLFFEFLDCLDRGMLARDIARTLELPRQTIDSWLHGHMPYPIRLIVKPDSQRSVVLTRVYPINRHDSESDGTLFISAVELRNFILREAPGLAEYHSFEALMKQAALHIQCIHELGNRTTLRASEIKEIASKLDIPITNVRNWTIEGVRPAIYSYIEQAIHNRKVAAKLRSKLTIESPKELYRRLSHLYLAPYLEYWLNYDAIEHMAEQYYKFLDMMEKGYTQEQMASKLGVGERTVYDWTQGRLPLLLHIMYDSPKTTPEEGKQWLPIRMDGRRLREWIQVPREIQSSKTLNEVVSQMGKEASFEDFMYVLGVLASDGYIDLRGKTSSSFRVLLSRNYVWSSKLLNAASELLDSFGLESSVDQFSRNEIPLIELRSRNTPFFLWVREIVLGLAPDEVKTYTSIKGQWILDSSEVSRVAFLQGLADGDGWASVNSQKAGIASVSNQILIKKLLNSFNIESTLKDTGVDINKGQSLQKASSLPLFRHATHKLENLRAISKMISSRNKKIKRVTNEEKREILKLSRKGWSAGKIAFHLWKKLGISRSLSTIRRTIKKYDQDSQKQSS